MIDLERTAKNFFIAALVAWAKKYIADREHNAAIFGVLPQDFVVGPVDDPQLQRWYLAPRNDEMNLYLHRFWRSDDQRALHDHRGDNVSLILEGSYVERMPGGSWRVRYPGDLVRRGATDAHRVELIDDKPVLSLFQIGPIVRDWGFHCPDGFRRWQDFVKVVPGGNEIGIGCG